MNSSLWQALIVSVPVPAAWADTTTVAKGIYALNRQDITIRNGNVLSGTTNTTLAGTAAVLY
jgi:hypothetical protein